MVDKAKCDLMLNNLQLYTRELQRLSEVPKTEFLADHDLIASAKYHFVIAIEACIDVANHIISSERYRVPRDNGDSFVVLTENGVLPEDSLVNWVAMARFRNRLVHLYWDVEDGRIREFLETRIEDFRVFAEAVSGFVSGTESRP